MLLIDVSDNNQEPNWAEVKASGVIGVWIKASEGVTVDQPNFVSWRQAANKAGLRVGAYHFARPAEQSSG